MRKSQGELLRTRFSIIVTEESDLRASFDEDFKNDQNPEKLGPRFRSSSPVIRMRSEEGFIGSNEIRKFLSDSNIDSSRKVSRIELSIKKNKREKTTCCTKICVIS